MLDPESEIEPGENWGVAVGSALEAADWVVFLLTRDACNSSHRLKNEIDFTLFNAKYCDRVIPVAFGSRIVPGKDFPWILKKLPAYVQVPVGDFFAAAEGINKIVHLAAAATA